MNKSRISVSTLLSEMRSEHEKFQAAAPGDPTDKNENHNDLADHAVRTCGSTLFARPCRKDPDNYSYSERHAVVAAATRATDQDMMDAERTTAQQQRKIRVSSDGKDSFMDSVAIQ